MKISITFDVGDYDREAINNFYGDKGKADYQTMRNFIRNTVEAELEGQCFTLQEKEDRAKREVDEALDDLAEELSKG